MPPRASIVHAPVTVQEHVLEDVARVAIMDVLHHARTRVTTLVVAPVLAVVTLVKEDWQGEYANILTLPLLLNAL